MSITLLLQYLSYFSSFIPLIAVAIYWYKVKFRFNLWVDLIAVYIVFYSIIQNVMLYLSQSGIQNLFIIRIFVPLEAFIFVFFILSMQISSKKTNLVLSILYSIVLVVIDLVWGNQAMLPVESMFVEGIVITILGMAAIPSIKIRKDYEVSFFYFIFGILFSSVNTLLGVGFIELAPELSYNIQAVVTITAQLIFTWGFFIVIKSER